MRKITAEEYRSEAKAQGVPNNHIAAKCPMCGTIQSMESLISVGVKTEEVEKYWSFSCVGRFTDAGEYKKEDKPGKGCNWTLGGLFQIHKLEVQDPDGYVYRRFELATPDEAQELFRVFSDGSKNNGNN